MAKETIIKMKREQTVQENIFTNDILDKGLISKIYKEHIRLNTRKTSNPEKMGKGPEQTLLQGGYKHTKRCTTSLAIREMQIKTTMRYHFTQMRMAITTKSANKKCW